DSYFTIVKKYWYTDALSLVKSFVLNTNIRKNFYDEYDKQLSGGVFSNSQSDKKYPLKCEFNVTQIEGEIK
ncbi:hypothetical protein, partial [Caminibacter pacificus]